MGGEEEVCPLEEGDWFFHAPDKYIFHWWTSGDGSKGYYNLECDCVDIAKIDVGKNAIKLMGKTDGEIFKEIDAAFPDGYPESHEGRSRRLAPTTCPAQEDRSRQA